MKFFIKTYGCQMNVRDSDAAGALLLRNGHTRADSEDDAEVVIVNTCCVRGKAEDKAIGKLGLLVAEKAAHSSKIVGAMGCMVERLKLDLFQKVPGLDFAVGARRLSEVGRAVELAKAGKKAIFYASDSDKENARPDDLSCHEKKQGAAFVNVLFGCNRQCAYCVVPSVRGPEWSRSAESILREIEELAGNGVKEVTLLGQSVMSYGRENRVWPDGCSSPRGFVEPLARLLEAVNEIPALERIRFTSGHPSGCTSELIRAMAELPRVCEHLHLPVQSGSDRILKLMNRGYSADDYRRAVERLKDGVPGIAITTDIIVGFPSETDVDFRLTQELANEMRFDNAFIFKYSPRPGTPAAQMADDVPAETKMARNRILLEDQDRRSAAINRGLIGKDVEVLAEGLSLRNKSRWSGRTRANKIVVFEPTGSLTEGTTVNARIERAMPQTLYGKIMDA